MMKKTLVILLIGLLLMGCNHELVNKDGVKFKEEYEALNGKTSESGKTYLSLKIPKENPMVYATYDEIKTLLTKGTGVIYFGFPECPWCRSMLETFIKAAIDNNVSKVLYYNNRDQRNKLELVDGKIKTIEKGTDEYLELLDLLNDNVSVYDGLNDETIHRLYFPTVYVVEDGKILGYHVSTLESVTDPYLGLSEVEKEELYNIYDELIKKLASCNLNTGC